MANSDWPNEISRIDDAGCWTALLRDGINKVIVARVSARQGFLDKVFYPLHGLRSVDTILKNLHLKKKILSYLRNI
jgi:nicotinic acid phosphoribosyltransferase